MSDRPLCSFFFSHKSTASFLRRPLIDPPAIPTWQLVMLPCFFFCLQLLVVQTLFLMLTLLNRKEVGLQFQVHQHGTGASWRLTSWWHRQLCAGIGLPWWAVWPSTLHPRIIII
jgi:hypothetical protein